MQQPKKYISTSFFFWWFIMTQPSLNTVTITVNEEKIILTNPDPSLLLVDFIRETLLLCGPKKPCGEGGCGGCTIVMEAPEDLQSSSSPKFLSINSCLRRVIQCNNQHFYTTEYFANMETNPSFENGGKFENIKEDIPKTIAFNNGSQCMFILYLDNSMYVNFIFRWLLYKWYGQ